MKINYGYLRVSTDKQDSESQKHTILTYGNENGVSDILFIEDIISSAKAKENRKIFMILTEQAKEGDTVIVSEVSRLGRNTLEVLELSKVAVDRDIRLIIAKQNMVFDRSMQSKIYVTIMGLVAEIERDFIQVRTKAALALRQEKIKKNGYFISNAGNKRLALGQPVGRKQKLKLFDRKEEIYRLLHLGATKTAIIGIMGCTRPTLERLLKRFPPPKQIGLLDPQEYKETLEKIKKKD